MSHVKDRRALGRGWVAVITRPDSGGEDHSRTFRTEKEAKSYITEQEAAKQAERFVSPRAGAVTVTQWWDEYRAMIVALDRLRPSTLARNDSYMANQVLAYLGSRRLRDLEPAVIQGWVNNLCAVPYAPATVVKAHGLLFQLLEYATAHKRIAHNPCTYTTLPAVPVGEQRFLDLDAVDELVGAIDGRFALATLLAAVTGLRASELFGLRVGDVLVDSDWLHVRQSNVEVRGHIELSANMKTTNGSRKVPVPGVVMDDLAAHISGRDTGDLVFTGPGGGPVRLAAWRRRFWYPATCTVGLGELVACTFFDDPDAGSCALCARVPKAPRGPHYVGLRLHDLRHTAASLWIRDGRDIFHVAKFLGQGDTRMVDQRYGHLYDGEHDAANTSLNRRLERRRGRVGVARLSERRAG